MPRGAAAGKASNKPAEAPSFGSSNKQIDYGALRAALQLDELQKMASRPAVGGGGGDRDREMEQDSKEPRFHVYIRLPFKRPPDWVDPPQVDWDETKSQRLWEIISTANNTEIDWEELAASFDVSVTWLLQMVTYLNEQHASRLRAQMQKAATAKGSGAPSPVPGSESAGPAGLAAVAEMMRRTGSAGAPRAGSALSIRKDSPLPRNEGSVPGTPVKSSGLVNAPLRPPISRNSSTNTAVLSAGMGGLNLSGAKAKQGESIANRRRLSSLPITTNIAPAQEVETGQQQEEPMSPGPADSSSPTSSSSSSPAESRIMKRPPRFNENRIGDGSNDDDEDGEPAFLPKRQATGSSSTGQDMGATLRGDPRSLSRRSTGKGLAKDSPNQSQTSDSSASSATRRNMFKNPTVAAATAGSGGYDRSRAGLGPLSPRRTAELSGRSTATSSPSGGKGKGVGVSREGSDGGTTPSMGSSFSDLDDASVTRSALEEEVAARMQDGGTATIGSRISQAFRSRYLPPKQGSQGQGQGQGRQ